MGLDNVQVMVPFVRTVSEGRRVVELLAENGLRRGENGLQVIMMCEVPSNALLAEQFLEHFDGFSIGSNDLTQLTLGLDRDSGLVATLFDERDAAVKALLSQAIDACNRMGRYVGICGQGPSEPDSLPADAKSIHVAEPGCHRRHVDDAERAATSGSEDCLPPGWHRSGTRSDCRRQSVDQFDPHFDLLAAACDPQSAAYAVLCWVDCSSAKIDPSPSAR
jgi:hypothetical protein